MKQQHSVVSKKVLQLILEHQSACNEEFKSIQEILEQVKETFSQCKESRRQLAICNKQVSSSLGILANYRKRKLAQRLLSNLNMIKNLVSIFYCSALFCYYSLSYSTALMKDVNHCLVKKTMLVL